LNFTKIENELELPDKKYKKKLEIKISGTIICFEANIPKTSEMSNDKSFQVYLFNDASDFNKKCNQIKLILKLIIF
jgi:hypothetical protein